METPAATRRPCAWRSSGRERRSWRGSRSGAQGHDPIVGTFAFEALGRALAIGRPEGFVKVVADGESQLLLGVAIAGPQACDLIAEATLALEMSATLEDVARTVHAHPTLPEAFMEACKVALAAAAALEPSRAANVAAHADGSCAPLPRIAR